MSVEWRPIPGFSGYEASDDGRIRSFRKWTNGPVPREKSQYTAPSGYMRVGLEVDAGTARMLVHPLICAAFYGPRPEGMVIRHLNGNPTDNRLVNLRYGTSLENSLDAVRHGTNGNTRKTHCKHGHEFTEENTRWKVKSQTGRSTRVCIECRNRQMKLDHQRAVERRRIGRAS